MSAHGAHHNVVGAIYGSRKNIFEPLIFNDSRIIIMVQKRNKEDHYVPTIR